MKIYLTLLIISVLTFTKGSAQFSNGSELLNFCKLEYGIKNKSLVTKKWIQEKTNNYIDDRGVKYSQARGDSNWGLFGTKVDCSGLVTVLGQTAIKDLISKYGKVCAPHLSPRSKLSHCE